MSSLRHTDWSVDDIHRYIAEEMDVEERVRFEQTMAEDAFFQDMVDGFTGHGRIHVEHYLDRLYDRFDVTEGSTRSMWKWLSGVAALLVCGAFTYLVVDRMFSDHMTADESMEQSSYAIQKDEHRTDQSEWSSPTTTELLSDSLDEEVVLYSERSPEEVRKKRFTTPESTPKGSSIRRSGQTNSTYPQTGVSGIVRGQVIDDSGEPLIGANIYFPANEAAITSDFDGEFAVQLTKRDTVAVVSYTGYDASSFALQQDVRHNFVLRANQPLAEVVVSDFVLDGVSSTDQAKKKDSDRNATPEHVNMETTSSELSQFGEATPKKGLRKYAKYIKKNLNYPSAARIADIEGDVVLQFKILPSGQVFDIRILQGLGYGCDEEAIRLISEGPEWEIIEESSVGQATYTIAFRLIH